MKYTPFFSAFLSLLLLGSTSALAAVPTLVDDFSNETATANGCPRLAITDKDLGGKSQATQKFEGGVLHVEGQLAPGRGAPAFVSFPLLLTPTAQPQDLHAFTGVRLKVRLLSGPLSVQVSSADVTNFDYHATPIATPTGEWTEVKVAFKDMKRAWSEQTPLNTRSITSINLVVAAGAPLPFAFAVDEVSFY